MMAKGDGETAPAPVPVLAVGLGRGFGGKSTGLVRIGVAGADQGRDVIVADGDTRSPDAGRHVPRGGLVRRPRNCRT